MNWNVKIGATLAVMVLKEFRASLTNIGVLAAHPSAFVVFLIYGALWIIFGDGLRWHSLATLATWGMTLVIQRAEHRDTQAIHAKLGGSRPATGFILGTSRQFPIGVFGKPADDLDSGRQRQETLGTDGLILLFSRSRSDTKEKDYDRCQACFLGRYNCILR